MVMDSDTSDTFRSSSSSLPASQSDTTWFDLMLSKDPGASRAHMWDDTPSYQSLEEESFDEGPKKRCDTPYYPRFQNPRLDYASTSYLFGDNRLSDSHNLMVSGADKEVTCKRELIPSRLKPAAAAAKGGDLVRCSSCPCKDTTCDHTGFESNISPIVFAKSLNPPEDDAVFLDNDQDVDVSLPSDLLEEDWGKLYAEGYSRPLHAGDSDKLSNVEPDVLHHMKEDSGATADCEIKREAQDTDLEKTAAYALGPETVSPQNKPGPSRTDAPSGQEEDSADSMIDYIIKVSKQRLASDQVTVDSSFEFQSSVSDIFAPVDVPVGRSQSSHDVSHGNPQSLVVGRARYENTAVRVTNVENQTTGPQDAVTMEGSSVPLGISNQSEGLIQSSQYLESNSDFGEIVDSSVSDQDDRPFKMLHSFSHDVHPMNPSPQNDESLSPVLRNDHPMLGIGNGDSNAEPIETTHTPSEDIEGIEEVVLEEDNQANESQQTFGNITHEDLDLSDHTGDYSPNPNEKDETLESHFRPDPVHHPEASMSFTDSSQSMGESVNVDSLLKGTLFLLDEEDYQDSEDLEEQIQNNEDSEDLERETQNKVSDISNALKSVGSLKSTLSPQGTAERNPMISGGAAIDENSENEDLFEKLEKSKMVNLPSGVNLGTELLLTEFRDSYKRDEDDDDDGDAVGNGVTEDMLSDDLYTLLLLPFAHTSLSGCLSISSPKGTDEGLYKYDIGPENLLSEEENSEGKEDLEEGKEVKDQSEWSEGALHLDGDDVSEVTESEVDNVEHAKRALFDDDDEEEEEEVEEEHNFLYSPSSFPPPSPSSSLPSPSSCASGSSAFEERLHLSKQERHMLLYDPPLIDSSKQEENVRFRQQQVEDYDYYLGRAAKGVSSSQRASSSEGPLLVSWSNRLIQWILYDDDIWCNASDTTLEDDGSMDLDLML